MDISRWDRRGKGPQGRAKTAGWLAIPHILQSQGEYKPKKYYCNVSRAIHEQDPREPKELCRGCGAAKLSERR